MIKKNNVNPFIIAEVGQNHQGKINLALKYVKTFASLGANAIKFQVRNNKKLFSKNLIMLFIIVKIRLENPMEPIERNLSYLIKI